MVDVVVLAGDILASSSDDDSIGLGALLLLSGFVFYAYVFFRYRNADKRHMHESETDSSAHNMQEADQRAGSIKGVRNARMQGANNRQVQGAQQSFGNSGFTEAAISNITGSLLRRK